MKMVPSKAINTGIFSLFKIVNSVEAISHQHLQTADSREWSTTIQMFVPVPTQANFTFWEYPCPASYSSGDAPGSLASKNSAADI